MKERIAYIIHAKEELRRFICIDALEEERILKFIQEEPARTKKFQHIVGLILNNIKNTDLYDKENINKAINDVYAIKMFKGGSNIRLYCKQVSGANGTFYVIVSELLEKKKSAKNTSGIKSIIEKVHNYEYQIKEYPAQQ